jgi:excisionase family DNA binding protein
MANSELQSLPRLAYSVNDTCKTLSIGKTKLYEEIAAGRIKPLKSGKRTLIPADQIAGWLSSLPHLQAA